MPKRKTAREIVLAFIDAVLEDTVPAHEALCDEGKCTLETPCPYCRMSEKMMTELEKF